MPRKLQIVEGPSFRGFALENGIVGLCRWDQVFTMDQKIPEGVATGHHTDPHVFQVTLKMFGSARKKAGQAEKDPNDFSFIAYRSGGYKLTARGPGPVETWFYIGVYNVQTRKGECTEFTRRELARSGSAAMMVLGTALGLI